MRLWDVPSGKQRFEFRTQYGVDALFLARDGATLVVVEQTIPLISFIDVASGKVRRQLKNISNVQFALRRPKPCWRSMSRWATGVAVSGT